MTDAQIIANFNVKKENLKIKIAGTTFARLTDITNIIVETNKYYRDIQTEIIAVNEMLKEAQTKQLIIELKQYLEILDYLKVYYELIAKSLEKAGTAYDNTRDLADKLKTKTANYYL